MRRRRAVVRPMISRDLPQFPDELFQLTTQRQQRFRPAQAHTFPVAVRQHRVAQFVREKLPRYPYFKPVHVRPVRFQDLSGPVFLRKPDFLFRSVLRFPCPDAPLQRPQLSRRISSRISLRYQTEQRHRLKSGVPFQFPLDFGPVFAERIFPGSPVPLCWQFRVRPAVQILPRGLPVYSRLHRRDFHLPRLFPFPKQLLVLPPRDSTHSEAPRRRKLSGIYPIPFSSSENSRRGSVIVVQGEV
ncbi:hypothetical protein SDC9_155705 [bioreactor metagenome]|uniref:Uncharacterized protein n=1 Tax=bioreactor metagenome TaxID=1076179 RepID=A0A645F7G4_9ZZZZ